MARHALAAMAALKKENAGRLVAIRVQASPAAAARTVELTRGGAEVIHLVFDSHGRECPHPNPLPKGEGTETNPLPKGEGTADATPRHARDVLREVHGSLVRAESATK